MAYPYWPIKSPVILSAVTSTGVLSKSDSIVDVGGGYGSASIGITKGFPKLKSIAQSLPNVVKGGPAGLLSKLEGRTSFMKLIVS